MLEFIALPAPIPIPIAIQLNLGKLKLQIKAEKKSVRRNPASTRLIVNSEQTSDQFIRQVV